MALRNIDFSKYQAEAAKSNRAMCRETSCKVMIGKGDLRIGRMGADYYSWYHAPCCFKTFDNWRIRNKPITSTADIEDFEALSDEHKEIIIQLITGTYVEPPAMSYNPRPKRQCATNVGSASATASNANEEPEEEKTDAGTDNLEVSSTAGKSRKRKAAK
jgi:hypothetical protein